MIVDFVTRTELRRLVKEEVEKKVEAKIKPLEKQVGKLRTLVNDLERIIK